MVDRGGVFHPCVISHGGGYSLIVEFAAVSFTCETSRVLFLLISSSAVGRRQFLVWRRELFPRGGFSFTFRYSGAPYSGCPSKCDTFYNRATMSQKCEYSAPVNGVAESEILGIATGSWASEFIVKITPLACYRKSNA